MGENKRFFWEELCCNLPKNEQEKIAKHVREINFSSKEIPEIAEQSPAICLIQENQEFMLEEIEPTNNLMEDFQNQVYTYMMDKRKRRKDKANIFQEVDIRKDEYVQAKENIKGKQK